MANGKIDTSFDWKRDGKKLILLLILLAILVFVWLRIFNPGLFSRKSTSIVVKKKKPPVTVTKVIKDIKKEKEAKEVSIEDLLNKPLFSYRVPLSLTAKRNPFSPPFTVVSAKEPEEKVVATPSITLPEDVQLTGIVKAGNEILAIIEGLDIKEVVQEGDEILDGFLIEKIDIIGKRVILKKDGKRFILELRGE